ncbi:formate dehydrogenase accessory sulfurtransferase FdhD [Rhizobium sp. L1K21]|uniref:formate dehydrogenase accessory sulfurtransferase FdhD n=1 Tax=Rhizobium sp. L1K21 TaxID=2954933 RepID=UPI002092586E|nr:formate dehydrogenase accessory sulfurtransferase FdhD [Rhizobium sp. L1K21]MCO6184916.1 formate dehydrogenase accessory sulfurtransferase FdhD [Rhizobium sp. L1K21]
MARRSSISAGGWAFRAGRFVEASRQVATEVPIAFSYGGSSHAVMMATPADLEDFAVGFSLAEGVVSSADEIQGIEIVEAEKGIDVQVSLLAERLSQVEMRRRAMAGPVGCGLCGVESIDEAVKPVTALDAPAFQLDASEIASAIGAMSEEQPLFGLTRAVHAAAFYVPGRGVLAVREDVGRHNALDKLCGALARSGEKASSGVIVMTSRVSVELVQKAARAGCGYLVAVSAPTALAIETARAAGICLIAVARGTEFEVFTYPERVSAGTDGGVAVHVA